MRIWTPLGGGQSVHSASNWSPAGKGRRAQVSRVTVSFEGYSVCVRMCAQGCVWRIVVGAWICGREGMYNARWADMSEGVGCICMKGL